MSKLDELKTMIADMFNDADDKASIEKLATINNTIGEVAKEQDDLVNKNGELIKSYKDLVKHTSFKDEKRPEDPASGAISLSFEDALKNFINKENK